MKATTPGIALIAALLIAGCSFTPKHTITAEEAVHKMDAYLHETIRGVPSSLTFARREVDTDNQAICVKWYSDSDTTGQVNPSVRYITPISKTKGSEAIRFLNAVASYWKQKSSSPITNLPGDGFMLHPYKHYSLVVSYYSESHLIELLGVFDGCIWRHGTPHPDDNP